MFDIKNITIVSSSNEEFVPHLTTLFLSLLESKDTNIRLNFYVIDDNISFKSKLLLNRTVNQYKARISYLAIDEAEFENVVESERIPRTAYYRISIPNLLVNTDRAIYLDCDMLCLENIENIWDIDLGSKLLAAVEDAGFHNRLNTMGVNCQSDKYFNSGLLLMDLKKWREEKITEQAFEFIKQHPHLLRFHDQDTLNAILHDRWLALHPRWNAQTYLMLAEKQHPTIQGELEWQEAREHPALIHFCGHEKPWHENPVHPYREHYFTLRNKTAFPLNQFEEISEM
ncbi:Lipopolysaccharide biosynthesis protein, LPS:glycosyltransferase [Carnobacterium iners]|uniref:Lipopolysaccharide biosynthesis protein, LPS:glycosyltransferase n=1 Tax=Carnobacterium iners TaxID=1073423 RepID=A0A1X7N326_9LACT|nr:glycosyltransferase family 8 protein [Carnobacterium iners]SEK96444.1 Lipopolysaccharide biosynthesis protein, LPS:glycosyltransferase [Carnobacterium iners]SMH31236.1 Lipopolysaccharide biosynthesis protein, LPS:glycosyltransferase [Carnobacterium iners]